MSVGAPDRIDPDTWSTNRLAYMAGWSEPTLRRFLQTDDGADLADLTFDRALVAAKAIKAGHGPAQQVIRAIAYLPYIGSQWLISGGGEPVQAVASCAKAMCWVEDHPWVDGWVMSSLATLASEVPVRAR